MHASSSECNGAVADRTDPPRGPLNTAWPLAALALLLMMLVRACVPGAPIVAQPRATAPAVGSAIDAASPPPGNAIAPASR